MVMELVIVSKAPGSRVQMPKLPKSTDTGAIIQPEDMKTTRKTETRQGARYDIRRLRRMSTLNIDSVRCGEVQRYMKKYFKKPGD